MTHDEIKTELSSFALGALDPGERQAVEGHLTEGCSECQRELVTWREVVGDLALASLEDGAPDLKPRLLERVAGERSTRSWPAHRRAMLPLALAAGVLLAIGFGLALNWRARALEYWAQVANLRQQLSESSNQMQSLTELLASRQEDIARLRATLAAANQALEVIQRRGLQIVSLRETTDAAPAEGHVLLSSEMHRALFYAFDLPQIETDKAYELWWITEAQGPVMAALFRPDQRGFGRVDLALPADAGKIQAAAVTIEPNEGVSKPTGPTVLIGKL
ncbi:MAG: anti-sigma factor [Deltaproteobacteria bacterium]|nr:anti-sigma factor [Deltaproteobacteria bacterium]